MKFVKSKHIETDAFTPVELKQAVNNILMSKFEDPETLKTQVAKVKTMYTSVGKIADDDDLVAQVLAAAPGFYSSVLTTEQSIIESKGENLTPEKLIKAMRRQYQIANSKTQTNKNDETELESNNDKEVKEEAALVMANGGEDHRRKYFKGHCKECGLYGHKDKDCWEHEENAHRRPRWWKSRNWRWKSKLRSFDFHLQFLDFHHLGRR